MEKYFESVIYGFSDSLSIIRAKTGLKGKGQNKLENLAISVGIEPSQAHNAIYDVIMLENVLDKLNVKKKCYY